MRQMSVPFNQVTVQTEDGQTIPLRTTWQDRPVILVFLRHFACIACRAHARQVWERRDFFQSLGASIIFVGNGDSKYIPQFKKEMGLEGATVLTDPELEAFSSAGFRRSFMGSVGPKAAVNAIRLLTQGYWQSKHKKGQGDLLQLGGVLMVVPGGEIQYRYVSAATGDFPPHSDLEAAMGGAQGTQFVVEEMMTADVSPDFSRR